MEKALLWIGFSLKLVWTIAVATINFVAAFLILWLPIAGVLLTVLALFPPGALLRHAGAIVTLLTLVPATYWTLARMGWMGVRFQPRLWTWHGVTIALFLSAAGLILATSWDDFQQMADLLRHAPPKEQGGDAYWASFFDGELPVPLYVLYRSWQAMISLSALLGMAKIGNDLKDWGNSRRFTFLTILFALVVGFPLGRMLLALLVLGTDILTANDSTAATVIVQLSLTPPFLLVAGLVTIAVVSAVVGLSAWLVRKLPTLIFDYLESQREAAQIRDQKHRNLADFVGKFNTWLHHDSPAEIHDDNAGSRFASKQEIDEAIYTPGMTTEMMKRGSAYGYVDGRPLWLQTEKHILIQASTRSGKGVAVIIPYLLRYPGSAFVLDPKGENARATGRIRAGLNDEVHYLDPFGISGLPQSRFNPLSRFTPANMEAQSKALAAALVIGSRDHWTASGQQLVAAVILYVFASPDIPPEKKDLVTVRRFLLGGMKMALKAMEKSDAADGLLSSLARSFIDTPEKEFGSILSTAQRETEILDNPFIAKCLAATGEGREVDFSAWHRGTMTVFLCLAATKFPTFNRWLRLVLTSGLDEMTDTLRPPPLPICFLLDELATLGHLPAVENAVGLAAGYGIQLVSIWQDVAQMKDLYKGRWASFIGNAGIRVLFNLDDLETAEYWSNFMGGHTVETVNVSQDVYGVAKGQSTSKVVRPLLTPDEIMLQFADNKMLVLKQGVRPIISDRVPYYQDPSLTDFWDDPRPAGAQHGGDAGAQGAGSPPDAAGGLVLPHVFG